MSCAGASLVVTPGASPEWIIALIQLTLVSDAHRAAF
jgi:hypothetical protein